MMTKWWDEDGYPSVEALTRITKTENVACGGCLDFVRDIWNDSYGTVSFELRPEERAIVGEGQMLRLTTGGWSGNESIIEALEANYVIRVLTWRLSAAGGLHIYQYPKPPW